MKQNTILLILFGVILIYYLCKSSREGVEGVKYIKSELKIDNNYQHYGCSQSLGKKPWYTTLEEAQQACDEIEECKFVHDGQDCDGKNYRLCTNPVSSVTHEGDKRACFWYPQKNPAEDEAPPKSVAGAPTSHECPGNDKRCHTNKETGKRDCDAGYHAATDPKLPCIKDEAEAGAIQEATPDPTAIQEAALRSPQAVMAAAEEAQASDPEIQSGGEPGGGGPGGGPRSPGKIDPPPIAKDTAHEEKLGPDILKKIKELEETITKLKFQTKRARLQGQNIVAVDKLDMGKLSMDLFNWQKLNKKSNVDVNLILGDHIKNAAKETSVKHIISPNKKEKSCDPVADEKEQQPPVEYKGYPIFTKPEFPSTQKYELPKGAKAGPSMNKPFEQSDVNTGIPKPFNTERYDQKADSGIEKSH